MKALMQSSAIHVVFAFFAMGGWALFANWSHPMPKPLLAALVQGGLSAGITYFLKRTIEKLAARFARSAALWAPPLIACCTSLGILTAAHSIAGTPELVRTIALPFSVATTYAVVYNYALWRGANGT